MDRLGLLVGRAAHGDDAAAEALVRATYPDVHRLCCALVDRRAADDLAQDVFVRVLRALGGFRGGSSARTWVLSIARRTCMDELRGRHRRRLRDANRAALGLDVPGTGQDPVQASTVSDLLSRLAPERRAAFVLTQELGLTYEEAAAVLDCPVGSVRSRVARARADLVALLGTAPAEEPARGSQGAC